MARIGVTLKDDTRLSLGPSSEVRLDRFVYAPGERRHRDGAEVRARRDGLRVRTDGEARAGLHPSRNTGGDRRRPRHDAWRSASSRRRRAAARTGSRDPCGARRASLRGRVRPETRRPGASRDADADLVVLLPGLGTGTTGRARVSNESGSVDLAAARDSTIATADRRPGPVTTMSEAEVQRVFGAALAALPPAPRHFTLTSDSSPTS